MCQDCSSDFRIWMIKFQHLGSLPIMIILLVHVAFLYCIVYHVNPDQGRRTPPYQVPKEIQTITSVCVLIWKCKCKSGFARATLTTNSAVIPDGHACFGKTYKNMPPCRKLTLYYTPISNRSKSHAWLWHNVNSLSVPRSASLCQLFFFFLAYPRKDFVIMLLFF